MQRFLGAIRIWARHAAVLLAIGALLQLATHHSGAQDKPKRPRITGIAHVRLYVTDIDKSRAFYATVFGLPTSGGGCSGVALPCLPVNRYQRVELQPAPTPAPKNWVAEIGFATDDVTQLRAYLLAHGVAAGAIAKDSGGTAHFQVSDLEGNPIAFVQRPTTTTDFKSSVDDKPSPNVVGNHLLHAGFVVRDRDAENKFYLGLLGFKLYWYGGFKDDGVDWYEIQVPDGPDWIEYMLNIPATADHKELGIQNHFSLGTKDIHAAVDQLHKNGLQKFDGPEIGRDGKWGLDAYDPDGTRVEVMEFTPAGKPCCHPYTAPHPTP